MGKKSEQVNYDIIIIGAGLAGISAAVTLSKHGLKVGLIEKLPFIGGRAASYIDKSTQKPINLGQHVYMRCCTRFCNLLTTLGQINVTPSPIKVPIIDARRYPHKSSVAWLKSFPLLGPLEMAPAFFRFPYLSSQEKLNIIKALLKIKKTPLETERLKRVTFASWLKENKITDSSINSFWNLIITPILNSPAHETSAYWGFMTFKEAFLRPKALDIGILQDPLSNLWQPVYTILAEHGGEVLVKTRVESIQKAENKVGVVLANGEMLWAKYLVLAVNYPDLHIILDQDRIQGFYGVNFSPPSRFILDMHLEYSEPITPSWLKMAGFVNSPLQWLFAHDKGRILNISISGIEQQRWDLLPEVILKELDSLYNCGKPKMVRIHRFPKATFSLTPQHYRTRPGQKTSWERLFLAGDWTDTGWPATMEGAVCSGEKAASLILQELHLIP